MTPPHAGSATARSKETQGRVMELSYETILIRLSVATALAMAIGWERERREKPAGLRTHMLVGLGAATFYLVWIEMALGPLKDSENLQPDPTRVFEGVITGIGFLGAGAIIQGRGNVRGLTTGAGIWVAGAIGLACGGGYFAIACIATAFTIVVLALAGIAESRLFHKKGTNGDAD